VHGLVDEPEVRGGCVGLAADVVGRGAVRGRRRQRDDQITHLEVGLQTAARADTQQLLDAELDELLDDDGRGGAPHAGRLDGDRFAVERPRVAQHPPLGVPLDDVLHEGLGDVLRPEWVTRQEAGLGVVTLVRTYVDWHGGTLVGCALKVSARCGPA